MAGLELSAWQLACYCFIFIVGLLGNLIVCLVVLKSGSASRRFRQVPFNIHLLSLAIADMTLAIVCLPVYLTSTARFPHPTGTNGSVFCKIISGYLLPFWFGGVSVYTLVIISFERYTAICKPFLAVTQTASRKTAVHVASAWCIGFIIQIPTIIGTDYTASDPTVGSHCNYTWKTETTITSIYACFFTFQYIIPAVIFLVNFYRIKKSLSKSDENLKKNLGDSRQLMKLMKGKKKTVRIIFVVSAAFFICWTPNNVMYFLIQYGEHKDVSWNSDIYQVSIVLGFFNSCINPFLYAFQSSDFRSHFQYIIPAVIFLVNFYRIKRSLSKSDENLKRNLGDTKQLVKLMKGKKKTVRIVFVVSAAFFICWTPNNVMYFLFQYGEHKDVSWNSDIYQVGVVLGFFNSCINPFLYAFQSSDFRSHCKKIFSQITGIKFCGRHASSHAGTTSNQSKIRFRPFSDAQNNKSSSSQNEPSFKQTNMRGLLPRINV